LNRIGKLVVDTMLQRKGRMRSLAVACFLLAPVALAACAQRGLSSASPPRAAAGQAAASASAAARASCPACTVDPTRYLRQLSLDLRGRPPSEAELEEVARQGEVPARMIDAMIRSDDLVAQVAEWHKALLWPNLDGFHVRAAPLVASDFDDKTGAKKG